MKCQVLLLLASALAVDARVSVVWVVHSCLPPWIPVALTAGAGICLVLPWIVDAFTPFTAPNTQAAD